MAYVSMVCAFEIPLPLLQRRGHSCNHQLGMKKSPLLSTASHPRIAYNHPHDHDRDRGRSILRLRTSQICLHQFHEAAAAIQPQHSSATPLVGAI
jgi:hypothetical protein